jgi:hypothetical protein
LAKDMLSALVDFCQSDTPDTRRCLLESLLQSTLIFPTAPPTEGEDVRLAFTSGELGRPVLPAFTDRAHVSLWLPQGSNIAEASASGFLPALLSGPFVGLLINSKSDSSVFIDRLVLEQMVDGHVPSSSHFDGDLLPQRW